MTWPVIGEEYALRFILVLARTATFFGVFPAFGGGNVPWRVKSGAAALMAILMVDSVTLPAILPDHWLGLGLLVAREALLGLLLGSLVHFIFMGAQFAGQAIAVQMGLAMSGVFDPTTRETVGAGSRFYYLLALLLFLGLDLHHPFLASFGRSFTLVPPGEGSLNLAGFHQWAKLSGDVLILAMRLALPILGSLLVLDIALGFMARLVPQMNIFLVGMPLKIALGLAALALAVGMSSELFRSGFDALALDFMRLIQGMR